MDTWYWALEYVRVFFAYVMILFVCRLWYSGII